MSGVCLLVMLVLGQTVEPPPSRDDVQAMVRQLGSNDYAQRAAASDWLWRQGPVVESALREATQSDDFEVRLRAAEVLHLFRLGIFPDTPPQVRRWLSEFPGATEQRQCAILLLLRDSDEWRSLSRLASREMSPSVRRQFASLFGPGLASALRQAIKEGRFEEAEAWLVIEATNGSATARRQLALLYWQQNLLPQRQTWLQDRNAIEHDLLHSQLLVSLYRAQGDGGAMRREVDRLADGRLSLALAIEQRDWLRVARDRDGKFFAEWASPVDRLGQAAVYYRLAGDDRAADARAAELANHLRHHPEDALAGGRLLLLAGRVDDALEVWRRTQPLQAFQLYRARRQFDEAGELVRLTQDTTFDEAWFRRLPAAETGDQERERVALAIGAARLLHQQRRGDAAQRILSMLDEVAREAAERRLAQECRLQLWRVRREFGMQAEALATAALLVEESRDPATLRELFPEHGCLAPAWWQILDEQRYDPKPLSRVTTIARLVQRGPAGDRFPWDSFVDAAAGNVKLLPTDAAQNQRLWLLAETSLLHGRPELAQALLETPADAPRPIADVLHCGEASTTATAKARELRRGDVYFAAGQFDAAIGCYDLAAENQILEPLALYLQGCAKVRSGKVAEGQRSQQIALLLATSDDARRMLFHGVLARKLTAEALAIRTAWQRAWPETVSRLGQAMGSLVVKEDPAAAADHWESLVATVLERQTTIDQPEGYLQLAYALHAARGRAWLQQGQPQQAERHWRQCRAILPHTDPSRLGTYRLPPLSQPRFAESEEAMYLEMLVRPQ